MDDLILVDSEELKNLSIKLIDFYYLHLGHVDIERIYFAEKIGELPKKVNTLELYGVTNAAVRQLLSKMGGQQNYCLTVWKDAWDALHPNTQLWLLFDALYSIEPGCNGKIKRPDIIEHAPIIEFFSISNIGVHWRKCDGELPCLLGESPLAIPLPPDPDEDNMGSTI